jgi:GNAT superfamily N-acetyltransferase
MIDSKMPAKGRSAASVRLATEAEAEAIATALLEAFREYEPLYTPRAFAATTPTAAQIRGRWSEGPVWVARQAGRLAGTVAAVPKPEGLYIRSMAVLPEARGRGAGRLLLKSVESFAKAGGFKRMFLSTTPFLQGAIGLYETSGFQRTAAGPHELWGTPLFTMEKILDAHG